MTINNDIIKLAIDHYGTVEQLFVATEELAELTQAISKTVRAKEPSEFDEAVKDMIGEIADVYVVLNSLKEIFTIDDFEIQNMIDEKQIRLYRRMYERKKA